RRRRSPPRRTASAHHDRTGPILRLSFRYEPCREQGSECSDRDEPHPRRNPCEAPSSSACLESFHRLSPPSVQVTADDSVQRQERSLHPECAMQAPSAQRLNSSLVRSIRSTRAPPRMHLHPLPLALRLPVAERHTIVRSSCFYL